MANVRLYRTGEEEITGLPCVCMRCGAPATRTRSMWFWDTIWDREWVAVPLCAKHWYYARISRVLGFVLFGMNFIPLLVFCVHLPPQHGFLLIYSWLGVFIFISVARLVRWFVLPRPIQSKRITKTYIELMGVAPRFVIAVVNEWEVVREHFDKDRLLSVSARGS